MGGGGVSHEGVDEVNSDEQPGGGGGGGWAKPTNVNFTSEVFPTLM